MKRITLILSIIIAALNGFSQCADFYDGFESGSYTPTWITGGSFTSQQVVNTQAAVGSYSFQGIGGSSNHLFGVSTSISNVTPTDISWYIYPNGTGAGNYVVLTDGTSSSATNCIAFVYWYGANNGIRFVASSTYEYAATPNQWYHIEMRNISWTTHTYDIYINGGLQQTAYPFRNATQNSVGEIFLYNFDSGTTGYWDDIVIGGNPNLSFLSVNPGCYSDTTGSIDMTITGGTPGYSYIWNTADTTEDINNVSAGVYSVMVTDQNGCTATDSVSLTEPSEIILASTITNSSSCGGSDGTVDITVNGGTPGYVYLWSNASTTEDLSGLVSGSYSLTVTDNNNCTDTISVTISDPTPPSVSVNLTTDTICINYEPVTLSGGLPSGGVWSGNGVSGNTFDPSAGTIGTNTITYTFTDSVNCSANSQADIIILSCMGLEDEYNTSLQIYPNPVQEILNIQINNGIVDSEISLVDLSGKKVISTILQSDIIHIPVSHLPNGVYILQADGINGKISKKIIKQ